MTAHLQDSTQGPTNLMITHAFVMHLLDQGPYKVPRSVVKGSTGYMHGRAF
jgi:hypothetical protein